MATATKATAHVTRTGEGSHARRTHQVAAKGYVAKPRNLSDLFMFSFLNYVIPVYRLIYNIYIVYMRIDRIDKPVKPPSNETMR